MQPPFFGASSPADIAPEVTLVTRTDLQGHITHANEAFTTASGYRLDELIGSPHSIVCHPDTPAAVFVGMWQALRAGTPWQGTLKNRCKNGQFFWVDACIVPIQRDEQLTGYMAVFKQAAPAAVEAAQRSTAPGMLQPGKLHALFGVRAGVRAGFAFVAALMLAGGVLGIGGLKLSDAAFTRLYHQQFEPAAAVSQVEARLGDIRASLLEMQLSRNASPQAESERLSIENAQNAFDEIHEILGGLPVSSLPGASAGQELGRALQQYTQEGRTLLNRAAASAPDQLPLQTQQQLGELQNKASLSAHALRQALMETAQQELSGTLERNARIRALAMAGIVLGLLLIGVTGQRFVRSIVNPLNSAIRNLHRIAEGDLQSDVRLSGTGETAHLNQATVVMQQHLKVMLDEIALASHRIHQHCQALNQSLYEVTEHSEAQHDQVHSALRALHTAVDETSDLSLRAERLMQLASTPGSADNASIATAVEHEARELATATRLAVFGAEEVAGAMRQVAGLIVENRSEAQLAWQASEELMRTAHELNQLVDFFAPRHEVRTVQQPAPTAVQTPEPETVT